MSSAFEESNLPKTIARVGLPAMLGQFTTLIYNMVDTFCRSDAGACDDYCHDAMCADSAGHHIHRLRIWNGRQENAGKALNFCTYGVVIAGVDTAVLGMLFLIPLAGLSGADAKNLGYTQDYLRYIFLGPPFIMLYNGFVDLFRSSELIRQSTVGLTLGNGVNIVLGYAFIFPPGRGAAGAAVAASLGFACSSVYYFTCMIRQHRRGSSLFPASPRSFHLSRDMVGSVVSIGIHGGSHYGADERG